MWNTANKITMARVIMIPLFIAVFLAGTVFGVINERTARYIATGIFVIASATDALDGYVARKYNLVTNFGKFVDPLADKLLVTAALICALQAGNMGKWGGVAVFLIVARELIITGFRTIAALENVVIAASKLSKLKTAIQMLMIVFVLIDIRLDIYQAVCQLLILISVILTVLSAVDHIYKNREVFTEKSDSKNK